MPQQPTGPTRPGLWRAGWLGASVLALVIGVGVTWQAWPPSGSDGPVGSSAVPVERRETRPTLDPAEFLGRTQLAYQAAREIPGVLDRLRCYCECDRYYGHKTLLSCYTDRHAAT